MKYLLLLIVSIFLTACSITGNSTYVPDQCTLDAQELICAAYSKEGNLISATLRNNDAQTITISRFALAGCPELIAEDSELSAGQSATFTTYCESASGKMTITYNNPRGFMKQTVGNFHINE